MNKRTTNGRSVATFTFRDGYLLLDHATETNRVRAHTVARRIQALRKKLQGAES